MPRPPPPPPRAPRGRPPGQPGAGYGGRDPAAISGRAYHGVAVAAGWEPARPGWLPAASRPPGEAPAASRPPLPSPPTRPRRELPGASSRTCRRPVREPRGRAGPRRSPLPAGGPGRPEGAEPGCWELSTKQPTQLGSTSKDTICEAF